VSIPDQIKKELMGKLWRAAGELGWEHLSPGAKTVHYDSWARDPEIGGVLERYMDRRHVRAFLKDGVLNGIPLRKRPSRTDRSGCWAWSVEPRSRLCTSSHTAARCRMDVLLCGVAPYTGRRS
jgi:hypothetical protein